MVEKLIHAARFSGSPTFSLFAVSKTGEYTLLLSNKVETVFGSKTEEIRRNAETICNAFKARDPKVFGLEIRCDGVRVSV